MRTDQAIAAVQRFLLRPGEVISDQVAWHGELILDTSTGRNFEVKPTTWLIGQAPWVEDVIKVVEPLEGHGFTNTSGLVFPKQGDVLFLNNPATMHDLGRAVPAGTDPMAYAELLAVLYSAPVIRNERMWSFSATESWPPGELVSTASAIAEEFPGLDPTLLSDPFVRREGDSVVVEFMSLQYSLGDLIAILSLYAWVVTTWADRPAQWDRRLAHQLESSGFSREWVTRPTPSGR